MTVDKLKKIDTKAAIKWYINNHLDCSVKDIENFLYDINSFTKDFYGFKLIEPFTLKNNRCIELRIEYLMKDLI